MDAITLSIQAWGIGGTGNKSNTIWELYMVILLPTLLFELQPDKLGSTLSLSFIGKERMMLVE